MPEACVDCIYRRGVFHNTAVLIGAILAHPSISSGQRRVSRATQGDDHCAGDKPSQTFIKHGGSKPGAGRNGNRVVDEFVGTGGLEVCP